MSTLKVWNVSPRVAEDTLFAKGYQMACLDFAYVKIIKARTNLRQLVKLLLFKFQFQVYVVSPLAPSTLAQIKNFVLQTTVRIGICI